MNFTELKVLGDSVALPTAVLSWFHAISIHDAAVWAAFTYTALRIGELLCRWVYRLFQIWRTP